MSLGPVMLDIEGTQLTADDKKTSASAGWRSNPLHSQLFVACQLTQLTAEIHALRTPPLLIAVDHEGGRVQRFREDFTRLPPMRELGIIWDEHPGQGPASGAADGLCPGGGTARGGCRLQLYPGAGYGYGHELRYR